MDRRKFIDTAAIISGGLVVKSGSGFPDLIFNSPSKINFQNGSELKADLVIAGGGVKTETVSRS